MHTRKQWKTDYLIQIEYQLHWMVKWKQDMRGSNHSYLFRAFRHLWKLHMKTWYPVSLLTVAQCADGTQSRNQSNEPPLGDSLLFKSDLMPLFSPTLPRDPKGGGFNWLVQYTLLKRSTNHPPYTLLSSAVAIWSIPRLNKASAQFIAFVPRRLCSRARFSLEGRKVIGCA